MLAGVLVAVCLVAVPIHAEDPTPKPSNCTLFTNTTCEQCIKNVACLWCNTNKTCQDYPYKNILPPASVCSLGAARWGVCWLNFEAMIISVSVIGGLIIIIVTLVFCKCCGCCCFKDRSKYRQEEERMERERQERSMRQSERKLERQRKNDDIRRKYGLMGSGTKYQPFENEEENDQSVA